jgi:1,4-alpha-glucan branching enzyme
VTALAAMRHHENEDGMSYGAFCLVLHSHLPYFRKSGKWPFGEENLFEAIIGSYLPLINALESLADEGIRPRATIGITPILAEQLADPYLQEEFISWLQRMVRVSREDEARFVSGEEPDLAALAKRNADEYAQALVDFQRLGPNLLVPLRRLQERGAVELITSAATHCFSPLLGEYQSLQSQYAVGVATHERHFGTTPQGFWLPECAYRPGIEAFIEQAGLHYFVVENTAIEGGTPAGPAMGLYETVPIVAEPLPETGLTTLAPYQVTGSQVTVLGRHRDASFLVWSAHSGYPGAGVYREFHKKHEHSGNRYWRLTGRDVELGDKLPYDPAAARVQVELQADHFVTVLHEHLRQYHEETGQQGILTVPFDTELFGHWWYEGVEWLKAVWRRLAQDPQVRPMSVSQALAQHPAKHRIELPVETSWGAGGTYWTWNNPDVASMWPIIYEAEAEMVALATEYADATEPVDAALTQAARELLLLESSDWPFLVTTGQAIDWAKGRFAMHRQRFDLLAKAIRSGDVDMAMVRRIAAEDNPFPEVDWRRYARHDAGAAG